MLCYDLFTNAFLAKVTEYDLVDLDVSSRQYMVDGFMKRAIAEFQHICRYDLTTTQDDETRSMHVEIDPKDLDELVNIVSEGMLVQWMKPYVYRQENLENALTTRDFTTYSPANLLMRVRSAYEQAQRDFTNQMREYSYNHGDLTVLHL